MKRYYVEEDDNGKEIKRKLTTFDNDDLTLEKCVLLSYDDHVNLYKLLNKYEDFQPYIFGRGCY